VVEPHITSLFFASHAHADQPTAIKANGREEAALGVPLLP